LIEWWVEGPHNQKGAVKYVSIIVLTQRKSKSSRVFFSPILPNCCLCQPTKENQVAVIPNDCVDKTLRKEKKPHDLHQSKSESSFIHKSSLRSNEVPLSAFLGVHGIGAKQENKRHSGIVISWLWWWLDKSRWTTLWRLDDCFLFLCQL